MKELKIEADNSKSAASHHAQGSAAFGDRGKTSPESCIGNLSVGFREPERNNSPQGLGLRLPPPQLRLGVLRAGAAPRTKTWPRGSAEKRGARNAHLRLRPACALPAPARVPGAWRRPRGGRSAGRRWPWAPGWARPPVAARTARFHLRVRARRAGRHCIYRRRRCQRGRGGGGTAGQGGLAGAGRHRVLPCGAGGASRAAVGDEGRPRSPRLADVAASPVTVRARNPGKMGTPATSLALSRARSFRMGLPIPVLFVTCPVTRDTDSTMPVSTSEVRALWKAFRVQEGFRLHWALMLSFSCVCNSISGRVV
ncbi:uncharacterized protein LOC114198273 [Eumetopias jubatus]|uniref:uncharacterized protein LOC114198273 n=1 Tax=Eumetopias jubatus TaxID=34886 RepID=UPI0010163386|nr:uncharacterized protein LOC114198273 [Eumetopias jubatus]